MAMQFLKLDFTNDQGQRLAARLDLPLGEKPRAYAIFAHCFTCTKNFKALVHINQALAQQGIAVLRFDFTGLGESDGDFASTNFSTNVADLVAAARYVEAHFDAPSLLIGHSLGGAAVLQAAAQIPSCKAVATIAAPAELAHLSRFLKDHGTQISVAGEAEVTIGGRPFKITRQFLDDLQRPRLKQTLEQLQRPLLIMHSPHDEIVSVDNAERLFEMARQPKSLVSLDDADHLLSRHEDCVYVGTLLAAWARKYLGLLGAEPAPVSVPDRQVLARTGSTGYQTEIIADGHRLIADEPIALGGSGTGPNPYDLLLSALGACTSMTLRMYADRKQWPVEAIRVHLKHEKIHATDCQDCETKEGKVDRIEREIEISGPLDLEQKQRLVEIAERCPVHRTLQGEILVETRLKE
jgi:uncharacterized OsmC-like protein/alpha-beta hydrolase superfamily lysophospholipase